MDERARARFAAATGLLSAAFIAASAIIAEMEDFGTPGDLALGASNEVFGTTALLSGFGAVFFFWFASTLAARIRQLEGGSGRLAAVVNGSGAIIAGIIAVNIGILYAARGAGSSELAALGTAIANGPTLAFPAAAFLAAGSLVALRTPSIPSYSMWSARLIFPLSLTYGVFAGLQLFKNYAWINEVGYITFLAAIAVTSIIGINRWGDMDDKPRSGRPTASAPAAEPAVAAAKPKAKPRARKPAARKR